MFRRLKLVLFAIIFAIIFATSARPAAAQRSAYSPDGVDKGKIFRGYTDAALAKEKKLIGIDKSQPITWEDLPLIQFPRFVFLPDTMREKLGNEKFRELQLSKIAEAQKRFIDTKLKDRTFSGTVRINRKEQKGKEFTIYSQEVARANYAPYAFDGIMTAYLCQCRSDTDRGFKVGENVDIIGKIEDLKEDGKNNTLFLGSVVVDIKPPKKKTK